MIYLPMYYYNHILMYLCKYIWQVLTYRPVELGDVELEILGHFVNRASTSTYEIFKILNTVSTRRNTAASYKNTHKRVKRLDQVKLIEEIKGHFERSAKHYRATSYGLISYVGRIITESDAYIKHNEKDIAIQYLLLEFFEEKTIDSFN